MGNVNRLKIFYDVGLDFLKTPKRYTSSISLTSESVDKVRADIGERDIIHDVFPDNKIMLQI